MDGPTPAAADTFEVSVGVVREANARGIPLKLLGGQAVRLLCPLFPHRARKDQDMDFACISSKKRDVIAFFAEQGFLGDQRFNTLHGDRQMYFTTADGEDLRRRGHGPASTCVTCSSSVRASIGCPTRSTSPTFLLTKLQVFELNRKDVHDILHLFSGYPVAEGDEPGTIGMDRVGKLVGEDWGWWRTATMNLEKVILYAEGRPADLVPEDPPVRPFCPGDHAPRSLQRSTEDPEVEAPVEGRRSGPVVRAPGRGRALMEKPFSGAGRLACAPLAPDGRFPR